MKKLFVLLVAVSIQAIAALKPTPLPIKLLIIGGSQGAQIFNEKIPEILAQFNADQLDIWHIAGAKHQAATAEIYQKLNVAAKVSGFEYEMAGAYRWADFIIARSGALTVSEIAACGRPAIFIPFPHAVDDHQFYNANHLAEADAAFLIRQNEFDQKKLTQIIKMVLENPKKLVEMSQKLKSLAQLNAIENICTVVQNFSEQ